MGLLICVQGGLISQMSGLIMKILFAKLAHNTISRDISLDRACVCYVWTMCRTLKILTTCMCARLHIEEFTLHGETLFEKYEFVFLSQLTASAHSSRPQDGTTAIDRARSVTKSLLEVRSVRGLQNFLEG